MYMPAPNSFEMCPEGTFISVCTAVLDLGTQKDSWNGKEKFSRKVAIEWETPHEHDSEGKPFRIASIYRLSSHPDSTFRKDLEAWRGRQFQDAELGPGGFKIENLLGAPCTLTITHKETNGKKRAHVIAISPLPKGTEKPAATKRLYVSLEREEFDRSLYDQVTEGFQRMMQQSPEWAEIVGERTPENGYEAARNGNGHAGSFIEDEVPF